MISYEISRRRDVKGRNGWISIESGKDCYTKEQTDTKCPVAGLLWFTHATFETNKKGAPVTYRNLTCFYTPFYSIYSLVNAVAKMVK